MIATRETRDTTLIVDPWVPKIALCRLAHVYVVMTPLG